MTDAIRDAASRDWSGESLGRGIAVVRKYGASGIPLVLEEYQLRNQSLT